MNTPPAEAPKTTSSRALATLNRIKQAAPVDPIPTTPVQEDPTPTPEPKEDPTPEPQQATMDDIAPAMDEIDMLIEPKGTSAENFKKLRTKLKSVNTEYKTTLQELESLRKKVTDYDTGLATPAQLQEYQDRIQVLEVYEKMYNLKSSPAYVEAIAKPLQDTKTKLIDIAKDYEVDLKVLDEAFSATNRAELNRLLTDHFDEVGALEVKSLIGKMKELQSKAEEAEKEPATVLQRLHTQTQQAIEEKRKLEVQDITNISKSAWVESLTSLREEDHVGLSFRDGDTQHNETVARPILNKAGRDYGVVVKALADHGLKALPKEVSYVIARSIQLAHESAYLRHENNTLKEEVQALSKRVGNLNNLNRPGGANSGAGSVGRSGMTPAQSALAKAVSRK